MRSNPASPGILASVLRSSPEETASALDQIADSPASPSPSIEIRADRLTSAGLRQVLRGSHRPLLVAVRRPEDGGEFVGSEAERAELLSTALEFDRMWVDVEWNSGLREYAADLPERRIVSLHGGGCDPAVLHEEFRALCCEPAAAYKRVPRVSCLADNLALRDLLTTSESRATPLVAFGMGRAGGLSRILALSWGSWATYAALSREETTAPGQWTVEELRDIYRVSSITSSTRTFGLVGRELRNSPSPAMHRAGYDLLDLDAVYVPLECDRLDELTALLDAGLNLEAFGVTAPFKFDAAGLCRNQDPLVSAGGSANTVVVESDGWHGRNTDAPAAASAVESVRSLSGTRVLILGSGGTGVAVAACFKGRGAHVTLTNRTALRAEQASSRIGVEWLPWERRAEPAPGGRWEVVVQTTSQGRNDEEVYPAPALGEIAADGVVLDFVYGRQETPLVRAARRRGLTVVDGAELLVRQGIAQFYIMTGMTPDPAALREACAKSLSAWI